MDLTFTTMTTPVPGGKTGGDGSGPHPAEQQKLQRQSGMQKWRRSGTQRRRRCGT